MNLDLNSINVKSSLKAKGLKEIVATIVLLLGIFLVWTLFTSGQYAEFRLKMDTRNRILTELADVDSQLQEIETLTAELSDLSAEDLNKLEKSLPIGEGLEDFLASMHRLALQSELTITSMFVTPTESGPETPELRRSELSLVLRGSYAKTLAFLRLLQRNARVVDIKSISLSDNTATPEGGGPVEESLFVAIAADVYNLSPVPETPLFPYGRSLDTTLLESEQFKAMQVIATILPTDVATQVNPFAPR